MSRTIALIVFLILLSAGLVFLALQPKTQKGPEKTETPIKTTVSPTAVPPDTSLSLSPNQVLLSNGTATVSVDINTGNNLVSGVQLEIAYDPEVLANVRITQGTFLPDPVVILNANDQTTGRISYALGISPSQNPVQGTGQVATITFTKRAQTASTAKQTEITILEKSLVTMLGVQNSVMKQATGTTILLTPTSNPDLTSDEPSNIGTFEGVPDKP